MAVTWRKLVLESDSSWVDLTDGGATTLHTHDHGGLDGRADDDHAQYALLAGRSGGQTLSGGTAANEDLTLHGTAHATKGTSYIYLQPLGGSVAIGGTTASTFKLVIVGNANAAEGFIIDNVNTGTSAYTTMTMSTNGVTKIAELVLTGENHTAYFADKNAFHIINRAGIITFRTGNYTDASERMRITAAGNIKIGGTADRATTVGTKHIDIFNGTAPAGTLSDGVSLYSESGELKAMDAAGNATTLSPHDEDGNWIFYSRNTVTGRVLRIDMERMMKAINDRFGWDFVQEYATDVPH